MPEPKEGDTQLNDDGELEVWNIDPSTGRWAWLSPTPKGLDDPNTTRASDVTLPANGAPDDQMYDTMKASAEKASAYPPMMDPLSAPVGVTDQGETAVATDIDMDNRDGASQVMEEVPEGAVASSEMNSILKNILSEMQKMNRDGVNMTA